MIDLTPLEVRLKKGDFRRALRGYDVELVDDFLDLISDRMEELVKQNRALQESVEALESEVSSYRNKERALSDALMTAQRLREDAKAHAQKEGELLVREARMTAEVAREEATRALAREEEALRQARARRSQMVESFRRLLERELSELDVIEESLELREGGSAAAGAAGASAGAAGASAGAEADAGANASDLVERRAPAGSADEAPTDASGEDGASSVQGRESGTRPGSESVEEEAPEASMPEESRAS